WAAARENPAERGAVSGKFLFGTVAWASVAQHDWAQAVGGNSHPLDAVGRLDALDDGLLAENLEHLRFAVHPQVLLPASFHAGAKQPPGPHRDAEAGKFLGVEREHESSPRTNLANW